MVYKIILVDDDYHVLEYLNQMIPWEQLGFSVVGCGEDGQQALQLVREKKPDVIMTDIGMPHKDGMTLIKEAGEVLPGIKSIFLTCFDDFHYAQEAVRLGAFDYILKETMDPEMIAGMMTRLKTELDQAQINHAILNNMKFLIKENLTVLRSKLLERLLTGDPRAISSWLDQHQHELELKPTYNHCIPILSFIDDYDELVKTRFSDHTLKFAMDNVIAETLDGSSKGFSLFYKEDTFFIFYAQDDLISEEEILQAIHKIQANLRRFLKLGITALIGKPCTFPNGLPVELNHMLASSAKRFYLEHGSIRKMNQIEFSAQDLDHSFDWIQEVKQLIIREDRIGLKDWVYRWKWIISERQLRPSIVKKWVLSLLFDVENMIQSIQNFDPESIDSPVHRSIVDAKTAKQLAEKLLEILYHSVDRMKEINDLPKKAEILKAQKYVLLNLDKKITLKDIADHLHMNPSYFSRIFKQHTQMNFVDYVNQTKIEEAKKLIDHTDESMEKIAEKLGFESKGYFLKVFKKYYGATPNEYKQGAR